MAEETKAARLARIGDEIGYALGRGEFPEDQIREFRFLWRITPDQEKDGMQYTLKDIEALVKELRRELTTGGGKVRRIPIEYVTPDCD